MAGPPHHICPFLGYELVVVTMTLGEVVLLLTSAGVLGNYWPSQHMSTYSLHCYLCHPVTSSCAPVPCLRASAASGQGPGDLVVARF